MQELLHAHAEATEFLREKTVAVVNKTISLVESAVTEGPGSVIGRYKILQQICEGPSKPT